MRAIEYAAYGDPEVLHLTEREDPHPGPGQVRIRVHAVGVNPIDWKIRSGLMAGGEPLRLPRVPGFDASGVVDEVGEGVVDLSPGDRVLGLGSATTAELAVLDEAVPIPAGLDYVQAAALPTPVETAARVLGLLGLAAGDLVVVDGAAGGVGTAVVQLAVARGLGVIGTASEGNHDHLRDLGAVATTYGPGLVARVRALAEGPVAGALDLAGRGSVRELAELTGDPARVVTIADFGVGDLGVQVSSGGDVPARVALAEVAALVEQGRFRVHVEEVFPWTEAAAAHRRSQDGHARGKLVLVVA